MLVLLVIFIITAPLMTRAIDLDLPKSDSPTVSSPKDTLNISITAKGEFFLDRKPITRDALRTTLEQAAARSRQTPVHLRAERDTRYEAVVEGMAMANQLGLSQLAFVTDLPVKSR